MNVLIIAMLYAAQGIVSLVFNTDEKRMNHWLTHITEWFYRFSNRYTLLAVCLLYGYFLRVIMPAETVNMATYTSDWGIPDGQFFYTAETFYQEIALWSAEGIESYINFRLSLDILWAMIYTGFLVITISLCLATTTNSNEWQRSLNLFPLIPMLCDLSENFLAVFLLSAYPQIYSSLVLLCSTLTGFKWSSVIVAHLILLYAIGRWAIHRLNNARSNL